MSEVDASGAGKGEAGKSEAGKSAGGALHIGSASWLTHVRCTPTVKKACMRLGCLNIDLRIYRYIFDVTGIART